MSPHTTGVERHAVNLNLDSAIPDTRPQQMNKPAVAASQEVSAAWQVQPFAAK